MRTFAIVATALLVGACSTAQKEKLREKFNLVHPVFVADVGIDGHRITLPQGQALVVRLPEDPATGMRWEMVPFRSASVIAPVQHDLVGSDPFANAGGNVAQAVFRLRGIAAGSQPIVLEYRRPQENLAAKTVRFEVVVP